MTTTKVPRPNLARIVYDSYPHSDLLAIDPDRDCRSLPALKDRVWDEDLGDSLFRFLVVEIVEGGQSSLEGAIRVVRQARDDVEAVLQGLIRAKNRNGQSREQPRQNLLAGDQRACAGNGSDDAPGSRQYTRIITLNVTCLEEDAEDIKVSLFNPDSGQPSWYYDHDCPLGPVKVDLRLPTPEEETAGREALDIEERKEPCAKQPEGLDRQVSKSS